MGIDNPIGFTGVPLHMGKWLISDNQDVIYKHTKFNPSTEKPIAIYCIHGTADRVASFSAIAERLIKNLPSAISKIVLVSFDERATGASVEKFSEQLVNKIKKYDDKDIILMGHSRGGLVAAYAAEFLAGKENIHIHHITTIGTPFWGSSLAIPPLSWISKSVAQMKKSSEFLTSLRAKISNSSIQYYHYAAPADWLVQPDSTCVDANKNPSVVLKTKHGHLSMMSSHELIMHLRQNIFSFFPNELLNNDLHSIMNDIYEAINQEIKSLKARLHYWPSDEKERMLMQLRDLFGQMRFGKRSEHYLQAQSVADFIHAYLNDSAFGSENKTPGIILNTSLIPFMHIFQAPKSSEFIETLIKNYGSVPLPPPLSNENNHTHKPVSSRRHSCNF